MAVIASRVFRGLGSRVSLVFVAILVSVAVGVSRIYLRAHYWSDVVGGWGLGFGIFGLLRRRSRLSSTTCATLGRPNGALELVPHNLGPGPGAGAVTLVGYCAFILAPALALLRPRLGEASPRLPHPLHARHPARHRNGHRLRDRLVVRSIRGLAVEAGLALSSTLDFTMPPAAARRALLGFLESFDEVSEAVESGAGLPEVARAAARALDASVIVLDSAAACSRWRARRRRTSAR